MAAQRRYLKIESWKEAVAELIMRFVRKMPTGDLLVRMNRRLARVLKYTGRLLAWIHTQEQTQWS